MHVGIKVFVYRAAFFYGAFPLNGKFRVHSGINNFLKPIACPTVAHIAKHFVPNQMRYRMVNWV